MMVMTALVCTDWTLIYTCFLCSSYTLFPRNSKIYSRKTSAGLHLYLQQQNSNLLVIYMYKREREWWCWQSYFSSHNVSTHFTLCLLYRHMQDGDLNHTQSEQDADLNHPCRGRGSNSSSWRSSCGRAPPTPPRRHWNSSYNWAKTNYKKKINADPRAAGVWKKWTMYKRQTCFLHGGRRCVEILKKT